MKTEGTPGLVTLLGLRGGERPLEVGSRLMAHALVTGAYVTRPINTQKEGLGQRGGRAAETGGGSVEALHPLPHARPRASSPLAAARFRPFIINSRCAKHTPEFCEPL